MAELSRDSVLLRRVFASGRVVYIDEETGILTFRTAVMRTDDLQESGVSCFAEHLFRPEHSAANVATPDAVLLPDDGTPGRNFVVAITAGQVWDAGATVVLSPDENEGNPLGYAHADILYKGYLNAADPADDFTRTRNKLLLRWRIVVGELSWIDHNDAKLTEEAKARAEARRRGRA